MTTVTNCYNPHKDTNYNEHDDDEDDDDAESNGNGEHGKVSDPFKSLLPTYNQVCGLIEDESDLSMIKKEMSNMIGKLMEKKRAKVQKTGEGMASMLSLPETDNRRFDTRKRPASSPLRKGTNR
jgi:hypothetical protein